MMTRSGIWNTPGRKQSTKTFNMCVRVDRAMPHSGKKRIIAIIVVCYSLFVAVLFFSKLRGILHVDEWNIKDNTGSVMSSDEAMADNTYAWKIRPLCRRPGLRVLYFVHTAPKNTRERRWIRQTLGDPTIESEMNSAIVFFVGEAPELNDHEAVLEEASREGDLVVLNFTDTYTNLTYKFMQGAKWIADNCLLDQTAVVVKLDDDVLVNLPALSAYLKSGVMALTGIHCRVWKGAKPFRSKKSKWYVSSDDYPGTVYPPYCAGPALIMQPSVLFAIYEGSSEVPFFWVDDVYITGVVAEYANVTLVQIAEYIIIGKGKSLPAPKNTTIFIHTGWYNKTTAEMEQIWQRFKAYNETVNHRFNRNVHAYYRSVA